MNLELRKAIFIEVMGHDEKAHPLEMKPEHESRVPNGKVEGSIYWRCPEDPIAWNVVPAFEAYIGHTWRALNHVRKMGFRLELQELPDKVRAIVKDTKYHGIADAETDEEAIAKAILEAIRSKNRIEGKKNAE